MLHLLTQFGILRSNCSSFGQNTQKKHHFNCTIHCRLSSTPPAPCYQNISPKAKMIQRPTGGQATRSTGRWAKEWGQWWWSAGTCLPRGRCSSATEMMTCDRLEAGIDDRPGGGGGPSLNARGKGPLLNVSDGPGIKAWLEVSFMWVAACRRLWAQRPMRARASETAPAGVFDWRFQLGLKKTGRLAARTSQCRKGEECAACHILWL
jgi:hypothetical protein